MGVAIPWAAAIPAVSVDDVLPVLTGSAGDPTPQIKDGCAAKSPTARSVSEIVIFQQSTGREEQTLLAANVPENSVYSELN